jgi:mannosyltransferase
MATTVSRDEAQHPSPRGDVPLIRDRIRGFWFIVAGLTLVAVALASYRIGRDSFWTDEAASALIAGRSGWSHLWTIDHGSMFLYYVLLKAWLVVAHGDAAVRALSILPFALTVACVAVLGRRLSGDKVGLLAAALVSTHPMLVRYGQEARGYSLVTFLVTAAVLLLTIGLQDARRLPFLSGVVLIAVAAYAHPVALATGAVVVAWLCSAHRDALPAPRTWIVVLFALVVAPLALEIARGGSQQINWAGHSNSWLRSLAAVIWRTGGDTAPAILIVIFVIVSVCYSAVALREGARTRDAHWAVSGLVPIWVVGTGIVVLAVRPYQSLLVDRYLLLIAPGVALLATTGVFALGLQKAGVALLSAIVVINAAVVIARGAHYRTDDWRSAQRFVAAHAKPQDGALFAPTVKILPFEYYQLMHHDTAPTFVLPRGDWQDSAIFSHKDTPADVAAVAQSIGSHARIWVFVGRGLGGGPSPRFITAVRNAAAAGRHKDGVWHFGRIEVDLYD